MPGALLNAGVSELGAQLRELEADTPPAELDRWAVAFEGKPEEASGTGEPVNFEGGSPDGGCP